MEEYSDVDLLNKSYDEEIKQLHHEINMKKMEIAAVQSKNNVEEFNKLEEVQKELHELKEFVYKTQLGEETHSNDSLKALNELMLKNGKISEVEEVYCMKCFLMLDSNEGILLRKCLHTFCMYCFVDALKENGEEKLYCPFQTNSTKCLTLLQEFPQEKVEQVFIVNETVTKQDESSDQITILMKKIELLESRLDSDNKAIHEINISEVKITPCLDGWICDGCKHENITYKFICQKCLEPKHKSETVKEQTTNHELNSCIPDICSKTDECVKSVDHNINHCPLEIKNISHKSEQKNYVEPSKTWTCVCCRFVNLKQHQKCEQCQNENDPTTKFTTRCYNMICKATLDSAHDGTSTVIKCRECGMKNCLPCKTIHIKPINCESYQKIKHSKAKCRYCKNLILYDPFICQFVCCYCKNNKINAYKKKEGFLDKVLKISF